MVGTDERDQPRYPLMRIITLGDFALERLAPSTRQTPDPPAYTPVAQEEWNNRRPAVALLKYLFCRANRRATRDELIEAIWPANETINAVHALDTAASLLRRHILSTTEGGSLLLTIRSGSETIFKLPPQHRLWVDADAFLELVAKAMRAECLAQDPLPLLEAAHALARGAFLEDDLYCEWTQGRRRTIDGARVRARYKLVDLYLRAECTGQAEELLFAALEEDPTDEDALCRLMILLVEQERRQEALHLYQYTEDVLQEEQAEPAVYTRELARRVRQGLVLRDGGAGYRVTGTESRLSADSMDPSKQVCVKLAAGGAAALPSGIMERKRRLSLLGVITSRDKVTEDVRMKTKHKRASQLRMYGR